MKFRFTQENNYKVFEGVGSVKDEKEEEDISSLQAQKKVELLAEIKHKQVPSDLLLGGVPAAPKIYREDTANG